MGEGALTRRSRFGDVPSPEEFAAQAREQIEATAHRYEGGAKYQTVIREVADQSLAVLERYERSREDEIRAVREEFQKEVDRERQRAVRTAQDLEVEKAKLEGRKPSYVLERAEDGNVLRFPTPVEEGKRYARDWQVSEIEAVAFDLRLAGADDWTSVKLGHKGVEATVPYPEAVANGQGTFQYVSPRKLEPTTVDLKQVEWQKQVTRLHQAAALGAWLAFLMLLINVLTKIF